MSLKKQMSYRGKDPKLTIQAEGVYDVYRLGIHLTLGQVEFAELGYKILASLKRELGKEYFEYLENRMGGRSIRIKESNCPNPDVHLEAAELAAATSEPVATA